jgi:hypothetical protein
MYHDTDWFPSHQTEEKRADVIDEANSNGDVAVNAPKGTNPAEGGTHNLVPVGVVKAWRPVASFLSDVYLCESCRCTFYRLTDDMSAYIFWSIFTSLVPTLFYFSVWELGIAGHELALLTTLSPILLMSPTILSWARLRKGRVVLQALSFSGLAAYLLDKPIHRLLVVAFATFCAVLKQSVDWAAANASEAGYQALCKSPKCYILLEPQVKFL